MYCPSTMSMTLMQLPMASILCSTVAFFVSRSVTELKRPPQPLDSIIRRLHTFATWLRPNGILRA